MQEAVKKEGAVQEEEEEDEGERENSYRENLITEWHNSKTTMTRSKTRLCRLYAKGFCRNYEACEFRHEEAEPDHEEAQPGDCRCGSYWRTVFAWRRQCRCGSSDGEYIIPLQEDSMTASTSSYREDIPQDIPRGNTIDELKRKAEKRKAERNEADT